MLINLSKAPKRKLDPSGVAPRIREYEERFSTHKRGGPDGKNSDFRKSSDLYYDLATDFYEF